MARATSLLLLPFFGSLGLVSCGGTTIGVFGDGGGDEWTVLDAGGGESNDAGASDDTGSSADGSTADATLPPSSDDGGSTDGTLPPGDGGTDATTPPVSDAGAGRDGSVSTLPDAGGKDAAKVDASASDASESEDAGDDASTCGPKIPRYVAGAMFCPRSGRGAADPTDCDPSTQVCCIPNDGGASTCETGEACAAKESVWACAGPKDCAGNSAGATCCLSAKTLGPDPTCAGFDQLTGRPSTICTQAAECVDPPDGAKPAMSDYVVCTKNADCPTGTDCSAVRVLGTGLGICL